MTRAELKQQAKDSLRGRWGTAVGMVLLYEVIIAAISFVAGLIPGVGSIAVLVVSVPLAFGFIGQMLKFSRNEEVGFVDFFSIGFGNFGKSWSIWGYTLLKLLPLFIGYILVLIVMVILGVVLGMNGSAESLLVILPIMIIAILVIYVLMIIKAYLYILTEYIGNDNLEMSGKDIVNRSESLMKGHRWEFFVLQLSFLGWAILSVITFGIGFLWLEPYMEITNIKFYESLANNGNNTSVEPIQENN